MKPILTWIVVANARQARQIEHRGAGHGLHAISGKVLKAEPAIEYADRAGSGHSIAGPATSAMERSDPQEHADLAFAHKIDAALGAALSQARFERLIIVAGPHMLGLLRKVLQPELSQVVLAEVDKDLSHLPLDQIETHLEDVFLV